MVRGLWLLRISFQLHPYFMHVTGGNVFCIPDIVEKYGYMQEYQEALASIDTLHILA